MKKNLLLSFVFLSSLVVGCEKENEEAKSYTTFKEYTDIVKNASGDEKNIFIFTQKGCSYCKTIELYFDKFNEEFAGDTTLYELSIEVDKDGNYNDTTMGKHSNSSSTDMVKVLDNRITKFITSTAYPTGDDKLVKENVGTDDYLYVSTPLIVFYLGNLEVKVCNNLDACLTKDASGTPTYESFVSLLTFPEQIYNWEEEFEIEPYSDSSSSEEEED